MKVVGTMGGVGTMGAVGAVGVVGRFVDILGEDWEKFNHSL